MRRLVVVLMLFAVSGEARDRRCYSRGNRTQDCDSYAFFEAFPASGAGTFGPCSTTAPTGAKGETLTFARASSATCTKTASGGFATTGIADGDIETLGSNQLRMEYANGVLGPLTEAAATNVLLRFIAIASAPWADVGTPALTGSQMSPFTGTYATAAVLINDNDGAAYEGRSQSVTVSAGAAYTMHCLVKGGTLAKARITLDGTAATITGLSTSTWSILQVTDASSSGVSISAQLMNGDATSDTGTVIWGGCQVEAGSFRTSIIPTDGATATRAVDSAAAFTTTAMGPSGCIAASVTFPSSSVGAVNIAAFGSAGAGNNWTLYRTSNTAAGYQIGITTTAPVVSAMGTTTHRTVLADNAGTRTAWWDAASVSAPAASLSGTQTAVWVGAGVSGGTPSNGITTLVQLDPVSTRCTP